MRLSYQSMGDKTVLITGAAKRLGAAIATELHNSGMNIVIHYRDSQLDAEKLVKALNAIRAGSACMIRADILDMDSLQVLVDKSIQFKNRLDVLINNASAFYPTPLGQTQPQEWQEIVGTNLKAPYFLAQACRDELVKNRGCIINLVDIYGFQPLRQHPVYSAAKAGLIMLTRSLAVELAPDVRVNAVAPGAILWPDDMDEEMKQAIINRTLLRRTGSPNDISGTVRFLIEGADYITGQVIRVDGGRSVT